MRAHGQIAKAVDHCDNDKIKTIKYLNKLKGKVRARPRRAPRLRHTLLLGERADDIAK